MENFEFNPQDNIGNERKDVALDTPPTSQSTMVRLVMKLSGGKLDETKANYVLLGVAVFFTIVTIIMILNMMGIGTEKTVTYKEDIPPEIRDTLPPEIYDSLPSRNN